MRECWLLLTPRCLVSKGSGKVVITDKGEIEADEILFATGRRPNIDLNLEAAGVKLNDKGGILVDDELRTTNPPRIYAAGDVIGGPMLEALLVSRVLWLLIMPYLIRTGGSI